MPVLPGGLHVVGFVVAPGLSAVLVDVPTAAPRPGMLSGMHSSPSGCEKSIRVFDHEGLLSSSPRSISI